jgi:5-methyltetrahydrofolate--homocysteine methyltransferase
MDLNQITEKVVVGDVAAVESLVQEAVTEGVSPWELVTQYLLPGMGEVGERFERAEFFVPEMIIAARAMQAGIAVLRPSMVEDQLEAVGHAVIGTVQGDVHDLGKNLLGMMLEGAGFRVHDLGADVAPERFVEAVGEDSADIVGLSALMTTTMPSMKRTIEALEAAGLRDGVKVLVGGAPVSEEYCDEIGADGCAPDASSGVRKAQELIGVA